jgi:hypothetical protein
MRGFKFLSLSLMVVSAIGALSAPASAESGKITASKYPATLTGKGVEGGNVFTGLFGIAITCSATSYQGEIAAASSKVLLNPTTSGCKSGERGVTTTWNGCQWDFEVTAQVTPPYFQVKAHLTCPPNKLPEFHIYLNSEHAITWCRLTLNPKENMNGTQALNEAGGSVDVSGTLEGVSTQIHGTCSAGLTINFNGALDTHLTFNGTDSGGSPDAIMVG